MRGLYYITYHDSLVLHSPLGAETLKAWDIKKLSRAGACVFADLNDIGVIILHYLDEWGVAFECFGVKLDLAYIKTGGLVIKNSAFFDIDLSEGYAAVDKKVLDLKLFLMDCLGKTISDRQINSLASVSALLLKKDVPPSFHKPDRLDSVLQFGYFGGRRQSFGVVNGAEVKCYDFPSMYGRIQCELYPTRFVPKPKPAKIQEPGFYSIEFKYDGQDLAPRLPIRRESGIVDYATSGRGLFWYEEIQAFERCGGTIVGVGEFIEADDMRPYLRKTNEYLLAKKNLGSKAAKGVANRIYGRLALSPTNKMTSYRKFKAGETLHELQYNKYKRFENSILYEQESPRAGLLVERNIGWASIITARGRAKLMELMHACESRGYTPVSVNTDSIEIRSAINVTIGGLEFREKTH